MALDVSPLRESVGYRALWIGQIVSLVGTQMRFVAIPFQVFRITGSTVAVGLISLAEVVPLIVFSIVGGALADAFDRRRIMAISQVGLLLNSAVLAALTLTGTSNLFAIYALAAIGGAVEAIDRPSRSAMLPSLVRPDKLSAATALRQVARSRRPRSPDRPSAGC